MLKEAELEERIIHLEDYQQIANLQGRYNHYVLQNEHGKILELFSKKQPDSIIVEMGESGECKGYEGAKFALQDILLDDLYNYPGSLGLHHLTTPVVEICPDGQTAKGMWYSLGFNVHQMPDGEKVPIIQPGRYNQKFVKEDGQWRYLEFRWQVIFRSSVYKGWVKEPIIGGNSMKNDKVQKTESHHPYSPDERYKFPPLPPTQEDFK